MLRFLATVFGCVHDLEQTALMRGRLRDEWEATATRRLDRIQALEIDLATTRKARDGQIYLNLQLEAAVTKGKACNDQQAESIGGLTASLKQAEAAIAKFRELYQAASDRAVAAEREAAFYRGIVGNVRRALSHTHCMENADLQKKMEARVHPEQRADIQAQRPPWNDVAKAQLADARAALR